MRFYLGLVGATCALSLTLGCAPAEDGGAGVQALRPGEVPTWSAHVEPVLRNWCGGCHSDVTSSGNCAAPGRCFIDDPCVMELPGCCSDEHAFNDCFGDEPDHFGYDVAECAIRRLDRGIEIARLVEAGETPKEFEGAGEEEAHMLFQQLGGLANIAPEDVEIIRRWVDAGAELEAACPGGRQP